MTLKDFNDRVDELGIDFGDLMFILCDRDSGDVLGRILDDDSIDCINSITDENPEEVEYYGCCVDGKYLLIYLDINNVEALIEKYYPDYYPD